MRLSSKTQTTSSKEKALLDQIKSLTDKNFPTLSSHPSKKGLYTTGMVTEGYLDLSFMISNLLKVCILALEADPGSSRTVPQPEHNIREVLGYLLGLVPHEEMGVLDELRSWFCNDELNG